MVNDVDYVFTQLNEMNYYIISEEVGDNRIPMPWLTLGGGD